jgi:hypothetical protein
MISVFAQIKERLSIQEVYNYYTGQEIHKNKALCIFHPDTHPSISFKGKTFFKCFVCGVKGSVIDFVMHYFNLTALEAAKKLNDDFNLGVIATDLTPQERNEVRKIYAKQKEINAIIGTFESWRETTEKWFLNVFKTFRKICISFAPKNFEEPSGIWLIATNHLIHIEHILETFSSSVRENLLKKYTVIEGWKYKILKELEVF